ncbi:class I SAM-dependent methyltransferase [Winogradskyella luteola]|uniref:Class I SAM-dependent methyltransferase n=1 Tax=Winogradskyella luteola TaxID=2828330 RepID=A0A9X1FCJ7_9FLAO|nr:class I SAM-dependent methyltransferase [Winogradskyella luteola]MBV7270320.1 class I SAM-dependent methyltransferase [Winogradskyella luteola]
MSNTFISKKIEDFYTKASEETRLESGMGVFEFERIKQLIKKHINKDHSIIMDIGGGTGKYSEWLANNGHEVHLIEPVMKHVKLVENRNKKLARPIIIKQGNAQKLNYPSNFADLIILHGPLYHLQDHTERVKAIQEAHRVLRKDGICLVFGINYTASTIAGLMNGHIHNSDFFEMCKRELTTSLHDPPTSLPWLLTEAYYHKPEDLKGELLEQSFSYLNTYAVEGIIWLDKDYFSNMSTPKKRQTLEELLQITENDKNLLALSPHIMVAVKK